MATRNKDIQTDTDQVIKTEKAKSPSKKEKVDGAPGEDEFEEMKKRKKEEMRINR